jgi:hypothetical protein
MDVELLSKELEPRYSAFLLARDSTMASMSLAYRDMLVDLLAAENSYLVAIQEGEIVGALPLLARDNKRLGRVYNSLPFYGSNGGIITDREEVRRALIEGYLRLLNATNVAAGTIITSPFETDNEFYDAAMPSALKDRRIGQFTVLPAKVAELMPMFHQKTRNAVRKGEKSGIESNWTDGEKYLDFLIAAHGENSAKIGVPAKPRQFFLSLKKYFEYGSGYRIYTAFKDGEPIASLLTLYFNKTAEYYVPATLPEYRELQPMSFLVYRAMCDAIENGYKVWNWGGTAENAEGVYHFKKRWGTTDNYYYYFTVISNESVRHATPSELLAEFPFFYVLPFSELLG